jgi:hypothetical protein
MGPCGTGLEVGLCLLIINFPFHEMSEPYFVPYQPNVIKLMIVSAKDDIIVSLGQYDLKSAQINS